MRNGQNRDQACQKKFWTIFCQNPLKPLGSSPFWPLLLQLHCPVAPRRKKIFAICFLGSEYFAQGCNRPFDKNWPKKFGPFFGKPGHVFGRLPESFNGPIMFFWILNLHIIISRVQIKRAPVIHFFVSFHVPATSEIRKGSYHLL